MGTRSRSLPGAQLAICAASVVLLIILHALTFRSSAFSSIFLPVDEFLGRTPFLRVVYGQASAAGADNHPILTYLFFSPFIPFLVFAPWALLGPRQAPSPTMTPSHASFWRSPILRLQFPIVFGLLLIHLALGLPLSHALLGREQLYSNWPLFLHCLATVLLVTASLSLSAVSSAANPRR